MQRRRKLTYSMLGNDLGNIDGQGKMLGNIVGLLECQKDCWNMLGNTIT